ncbi:IclR family transcriptional regulator C-terminal domain-containing protein, partial [Klebsiella quasipneumoniae]|uniref:IclR family transcriptional regulator C-terminal domain-containing protein n=1 Tax=Klebsiella quasipneumoniae TaxID=1463165 RepID=UPI00344C860E
DTTITDPIAVKEELQLTRGRGYSTDRAEHQPGLHCVGAPIRDLSGRVFAAISISGPERVLPVNETEGLAKIVVFHADAISRSLGYSSQGAT